MRKLLFAAILFAANITYSQEEKGIHFEHNATWPAIQAKAKAENKFIFMDAFTTWCGPCKMMAKNIFPLPEVGAFFNANYICLKVQLDSTSKDNDEVKSWYTDAHAIIKDYKVNAYPTYLFFSPDGKLVHRAVGSSDAAEFIAKGKEALDPAKQYYTLAARFEAGERNPTFLKSISEAALSAYDKAAMPVYGNAYLATQKDLTTEDNIRFLDEFTESSKDPGFEIIAKNPAAFNKVLGAGKAESKIREIVLNEEIYPLLESDTKPDWNKVETYIASKYPGMANEIVANGKVIYYKNTGDWQQFSASVSDYIKKYGSKTSAAQLNNYAWSIFENCSDIACLNQALNWSKKSVDLTNNPMFIDTYANLLYKTGKKDLAVQWEEKALKLVKESKEDFTGYEQTLEKMKKGEKTL